MQQDLKQATAAALDGIDALLTPTTETARKAQNVGG
jgi:hypothetical protein